MPKLSVIVPVYNAIDYLQRCVDSIINQSLKELEIILVDDGSTDGSGEMCDAYAKIDSRIRVLHQRNLGQQAAQTAGFRVAKGEYITTVDADDWIDSRMYEILCSQMNGIDMVTSGMIRCSSDGIVARYMVDNFPKGTYSLSDNEDFWRNLIVCRKYSNAQEISGILPSKSNKIFRRSLLQPMMELANISIRWDEDFLFVLLYLLRCETIKITHDCYYYYRINYHSVTYTYNPDYLRDVGKMYHLIRNELMGHKWERDLLKQLQMRLLYYLYRYTPTMLNFDETIRIPTYSFPDDAIIQGKKVVLFGAGRVGSDYFYDWNKRRSVEVVLWVDNSPPMSILFGKHVEVPQMIKNVQYDYIVCAVNNESAANSIRNQLINLGIKAECILWSEPINVWLQYFLSC